MKCKICGKSTKIIPDQKQGVVCCDELLKMNETNFFVILPIKGQIVESVRKNWDQISKFDTSGDPHAYNDAHDGEILRNILNYYKDSDINVLSLCLNVDGANKFKSNSFSIWPIQLMQNFLPPHIRFLPENIILNGLFYHNNKDDSELSFHEYMRPLVDELIELNKDLVKMEIDGVQYNFMPIVTHCAVDLPAKSKIQETKQFCGYYACTYCKIPGKKVLIQTQKSKPKANPGKISTKTSTSKQSCTMESNKTPRHYVRYVEGETSHKLRDETETLEEMLTASEFENESIEGIKGKVITFEFWVHSIITFTYFQDL